MKSRRLKADEVCDELTDAEKKILLSDVENIIMMFLMLTLRCVIPFFQLKKMPLEN